MLDFSRLPGLYAAKHRTQASFAKSIGVSQSYISQLARNEKRVSLALLERIAKELDISIPDLMSALARNIA